MDAINLGLGTPEAPFNFEAERVEVIRRINEAKRSGVPPPHLRTDEATKTTKAGRKLSAEELEEVAQYDDYVQKLYDTLEWKQAVQLLRDRLARLPPKFNTYKLLINAEANCGALDAAARHAKEAYEWDPLMSEAYIMMARLDCIAMQPERSEAWLSFAEMVPGNEFECGAQMASARLKIKELSLAMERILRDVTHLFCLPDFWVRLSNNVEYYRSFASDETRELISEIQRDPSSLRKHLRNDKIQWLVSMLCWTSAPLTYAPPSDQQLATRHWRKMNSAKTSTLMALPIELILNILDFVDPPSLGRLPQVSSFWKDLLGNDHRIWKRLYLNMWDPPIIYHVPDWLWMHAFRQRYGLCLTLARIWTRRDGDYSPSQPSYDRNVRHLLSKFSFISPSLSDSLSLIPDFVYGNVNHNLYSISKFCFDEQETSEAWPTLQLSQSPSPTPNKSDPEDSSFLNNYFSQVILYSHPKPEPVIDQRRITKNKAIPVFSRDTQQSLYNSNIINVCYYVLSKTDYGEETQQAAKALSALAFHDRHLAHYLISMGAVERFAQFSLGDQNGEAADLVATLLLHKHGIAREASESLHSACRIFPRLWAMNIIQDIKDTQRWVAGLSGMWRGRFFVGQPGYDTAFTEHFLYLQFHPDINFGHFVPQKDLDAAIAEFKASASIKTEYRFNSSGWIPSTQRPSQTSQRQNEENSADEIEDDEAEADLFQEEDQSVQEGECRITGSGIDDFGPYRVFGRLNVVYKSVFLAKRYEFEPQQSQVVYLGGDLGIWGLGGTLKTLWPRNGSWKWWKDSRDYTLDELHDMRQEAELAMQYSVASRRNREKLRMRLRRSVTQRLHPQAPAGVLVGDDGMGTVHQLPPGLDQQQTQQASFLRRGLRWAEMDFQIINIMLDPVAPSRGPELSPYSDVKASRGEYLGWVPPQQRQAASSDPDSFVWYHSDSDYGRPLLPIHSMDDEPARVDALMTKPLAQTLFHPVRGHAGHCDMLSRLIAFTNALFHIEHSTESMHMLQQYEQDIEGLELPRYLSATLPLKRFQGEPDNAYIHRRRIFDRMSLLTTHIRSVMISLHKAQAKEDSEYLNRSEIPFDDPRKVFIAHRWIDDWLRLPARMYIHDQDKLHRALALALSNPDPDNLLKAFADCCNEETEIELVLRHDKNPTPTRSVSMGGPVLDDDADEELEDMIETDDEELDILNSDHAHILEQDEDEQIRGRQARWLEVGIALLTVGLALVVGIRYLTAKKRH